MKLYHGSPYDLSVLEPQQARGLNEFENTSGVFLTETFLHAALYAISKSLKGKVVFGVSERKLVIVGDVELEEGWVYEVEVEEPIKGPRGQYACEHELIPVKKTKVRPDDFGDYVVRVGKKEDVLEELERV